MITRIELRNFKRFQHFVVKTRDGNILVGPNNSGKSSILDALRIFEACYRYTKQKRPSLIRLDGEYFDGFEIPESYLPMSLDNITTNYNENDAIVKITHSNGSIANIRLHPERSVKFIIDANGQRFSTSNKFRQAFPLSMIIVPPLAPLESKEPYVQDETVNRNKATRLAARNFRNIWFRENDETFKVFKQRVEDAWPEVSLEKPELVREQPPRLEMFFSEKRITREIQWAGFGFQIWLQIHTHLLRGNADSILVLDEPDIYLHPDLQHRLYHDVKNIFPQYFLATHAPEIINEAETKEILVVNPDSRSAKSIRGDNDYEEMLSYIGSAENADFAKISRVKKVVFVEGHDAKLLRRISSKIGLEKLATDRDAPIFQLGGFSQWRRAKNTVWAFKELLGVEIEAICLFDRDYRSDHEISDFIVDIEASGMECFVFNRKEIENYLLSPLTIARVVNSKSEDRDKKFNEQSVVNLIENEANEMKTEVMAQITSNCRGYERTHGSSDDDSTILKRSISGFEKEWRTFDGKVRLAPGKELLKQVLLKIRENEGVSVSPLALASSLHRDEIPEEIKELLERIDSFFGN